LGWKDGNSVVPDRTAIELPNFARLQQQNKMFYFPHHVSEAKTRSVHSFPWSAEIGGRGGGTSGLQPAVVRPLHRRWRRPLGNQTRPSDPSRTPPAAPRAPLARPGQGPHKEHDDTDGALPRHFYCLRDRLAWRQWLEHLAAPGGGAEAAAGGTRRRAGARRCGRGTRRRRRTRCCWSTCACTGPGTGAPFDPKASCRAPASPAASAG